MNLSYIATNLQELMDQAPPEIQALIKGKNIDEITAVFGKMYKIPLGSYLGLSNIITFVLLGALKPEDTLRAIDDILGLSAEDAYKLAQDLDKTIFEKARISVLGKSPQDMVTITFPEGGSPDELRKELLDTTKRDPVLPPQGEIAAAQAVSKPATSAAGTRSQLLEQLQILDDIPNDSEINDRLQKIQEQIKGMQPQEEDGRALTSQVALQEFMPKEGDSIVATPELRAATYSRAPTKYNVDPYREIPE